jgi:hypothetical protein
MLTYLKINKILKKGTLTCTTLLGLEGSKVTLLMLAYLMLALAIIQFVLAIILLLRHIGA